MLDLSRTNAAPSDDDETDYEDHEIYLTEADLMDLHGVER